MNIQSISQANECRPKQLYNAGVTLIEVLVVCAIVGILLAITLPAVQAARESVRNAQCRNNLRQIAIAASSHEQLHGHYPTGGWGWSWHGDPDRGFTHRQPGGWLYNVLPFLEQPALRELGSGSSVEQKRAAGRIVAETYIRVVYCPTRRPAAAYPYVTLEEFVNIDRPEGVGRTDYAAVVGDKPMGLFGPGPSSLAEGDSIGPASPDTYTGIVFRASAVRPSDISDGLSNTYLVAEKVASPAAYASGTAPNDDQSMYVGFDRDTLRSTAYPPRRDDIGLDYDAGFGSAHPAGFNAANCDGSVRIVSYKVDPEVHRMHGNRSDSGTH